MKIRTFILKIFWLLLPKQFLTKNMSSSISGVIQNWVLLNIISQYRPKLKTISSDISNIVYELDFPDNKTLIFKIEYNPANGVEFHFISTNIIHLNTLTMVLNELTDGLKNKAQEIQAYFEVQISQFNNNQ